MARLRLPRATPADRGHRAEWRADRPTQHRCAASIDSADFLMMVIVSFEVSRIRCGSWAYQTFDFGHAEEIALANFLAVIVPGYPARPMPREIPAQIGIVRPGR